MPKPPRAHWRFHEVLGTAEEHLHRVLPNERAVWDFEITGPAIVLGSRQHVTVLDVAACDASGIDVVYEDPGLQSEARATVTPASIKRRASGNGERVHSSAVGSKVATVDPLVELRASTSRSVRCVQ